MAGDTGRDLGCVTGQPLHWLFLFTFIFTPPIMHCLGSVILCASGCLLLKMGMSLLPCCTEGVDIAQVLEIFELEVQRKWKSLPFFPLILFGSQSAQRCPPFWETSWSMSVAFPEMEYLNMFLHAALGYVFHYISWRLEEKVHTWWFWFPVILNKNKEGERGILMETWNKSSFR